MGELNCTRGGCNNTDIQIYIFDWKHNSPATTIEIRCPKCELKVFYNLQLAQDDMIDRIDET